MLFFRIISLFLLSQACVEAAIVPSSEETLAEKVIVTRMAAVVEIRPYGDILNRMQSEGDLLIGDDDDETTSARRAAANHAFWANYCGVKLKQEPLLTTDGRQIFSNLLALIRDPKAPKTERLTLDDEGMMLDIASIKFRISCDLLLAERDEVQRNDLWKAEALLAPLSPEVEKCMEWFLKTLLSKDGQVPQGRSILIGRLVKVSDFLNDLATSDNLEKRNRAKHILESNVIANAGECPDRAIAGLDDMDFDMALFYAHNLEHAIHFLVRQYKKQVIQDYLVEHEYAESAQEYVYLLLLLNNHFNLGVSSSGIWSAQCGARKPFDEAACILMDSLSVEGLCHYIAKHAAFRSFLRSQPEYTDAIDTAASDPELAEDAVYAYVRSIVEPYIYATFALEGEKFQELTAEDIEAMNVFLEEEAA